MASLKEIRTSIIRALQTATGCVVIVAEQNAKAPPYPYGSLKVTQHMNLAQERWQESYIDGNERVYKEVVEFVISVTFLNNGVDTVQELAEKARAYFRIDANRALEHLNVNVIEVTNVTDRTTVLEIDFEHRVGFDVRLQTTTEERRAVDTFDRVEIEQIGSG